MRPLVIAHVARGHRAAVQKAVSHLLLEFSYRLETGITKSNVRPMRQLPAVNRIFLLIRGVWFSFSSLFFFLAF